MNDARYKWILYLIVVVILCTIGIQVYWNYKNYLNSKQQLINDVQISLDKAVDDYYANLAEKSTFDFAFKNSDSVRVFRKYKDHDSITKHIDINKPGADPLDINFIRGISIHDRVKADSLLEFDFKQHNNPDSLKTAKFRTLTSKVLISLTNDSLSLKGIDSLLKIELFRKNIAIDYSLKYKTLHDSIRTYKNLKVFKFAEDSIKEKHLLRTNSESAFLPRGSSLSINFTNESQIILKRIWGSILISLLLILAIISSLFYLLKVIKHQKQLAEVKNDLISNITHEFKTPIATISVALESIKDFNIIEDKVKTKKYLELSTNQLSKLNLMVEKLLETATLDSDSLSLHKESINVGDLLNSIVEKQQMQTSIKTINFTALTNAITANVDVFHFENALNNILDNAIKYGGNHINVNLSQNTFAFTISISDDGNTITNANKDKIFEKFYRISKGNTHDVKGFGIGLYYTKKIVEKHGGAIQLQLEKNLTTFKLSFPNE
jgi:two-component system phosphate regulon sensor histidine kinase PhoR